MKYAKIMTDATKYGLYDNIWFTVKKIRRFYGKIPGIWLPVLLPGRLPVEHF